MRTTRSDAFMATAVESPVSERSLLIGSIFLLRR